METKTIYSHQATTTEDSTRNSAYIRGKQTKPQEDGGEEKTCNQRPALMQLHSIKSSDSKKKLLIGRNHHIPINTNTEFQRTQLLHQKIPFGQPD
jgi:hypothetical protein